MDSFRRGAASFAFRSGVLGELIQHFGDWASDAYKTYLEISLPVKVQVAEQMKLHILQHTSVVSFVQRKTTTLFYLGFLVGGLKFYFRCSFFVFQLFYWK